MTQGKFSKEEATVCRESLKEIMDAFPKKKILDFFGHFNDLDLFLMAAQKAAPSEALAHPEEAS